MKSLAPILALVLVAPALRADTIKLVSGTTVDGVRIASETHERIEYRKPGVSAPQNYKSSEVESVVYSRTSAEYRDGVAKLAEGELVVGAGFLAGAADDDELPDHVRATALAKAADALLANGNVTDALGLYNQLLGDYPDTRHKARALLGKGKAALQGGKAADAQAAFDKLVADAQSQDLGRRWAVDAEYWSLVAGEVQGAKAADVLERYADLRTRAGNEFAAIGNRCALRIGRLHLAQGDVEKALPFFTDIIDNRLGTEDEIAAGAFNGRGRCAFHLADQLRQGSASDQEQALQTFKSARLDFLRVIVHYPGAASEQAEALYWAAQCFLNVADDDAQRWAAVLQKRLTDRYPVSPWAKRVSG